jgi:cell division protein FtsZ
MVLPPPGRGGATGTGSIPVAAEVARSIGAVTIAVVTTPFSFEVGRRQRNANEGLATLRQHTHTLISIPNDRILLVAPHNLPLDMAFRLADDVLRQSVQGITELITEPGLINVDFAHIRRLIQSGGGALMSIGLGKGDEKTAQAIDQALHNPLLGDISIENAAGTIANFSGGDDLSLVEVQESLMNLQKMTGENTEIVMGVINDSSMSNRVQVILVITGLGSPTLEETMLEFSKDEKNQQNPQKRDDDNIVSGHGTPVKPAWQQQPYLASTRQNLDIPAFLRRRSGFAD